MQDGPPRVGHIQPNGEQMGMEGSGSSASLSPFSQTRQEVDKTVELPERISTELPAAPESKRPWRQEFQIDGRRITQQQKRERACNQRITTLESDYQKDIQCLQEYEAAQRRRIEAHCSHDAGRLNSATSSLNAQLTRLIAHLKIGHIATVNQLLADLQPEKGRSKKIQISKRSKSDVPAGARDRVLSPGRSSPKVVLADLKDLEETQSAPGGLGITQQASNDDTFDANLSNLSWTPASFTASMRSQSDIPTHGDLQCSAVPIRTELMEQAPGLAECPTHQGHLCPPNHEYSMLASQMFGMEDQSRQSSACTNTHWQQFAPQFPAHRHPHYSPAALPADMHADGNDYHNTRDPFLGSLMEDVADMDISMDIMDDLYHTASGEDDFMACISSIPSGNNQWH